MLAPEIVSTPLPVLLSVKPAVLLLSMALANVTLLLTVSMLMGEVEFFILAERSKVVDVPYCRVPPVKVMLPVEPNIPAAPIMIKVPALMVVPPV